MTCTERCRRAAPGECCCECKGEHHGEAGPQRRLPIALAATLPIEVHPEDCAGLCCKPAPLDSARVRLRDAPFDSWVVVSVADHSDAREPYFVTLEGVEVRLSPAIRPDESPCWIARAGGRMAIDPDPDVAARKVAR